MKKAILADKMQTFETKVKAGEEEAAVEAWQREMDSRRFMSAVLEFNTEYNLAMCECYGRVDPQEENLSQNEEAEERVAAAAGGGGGGGERGEELVEGKGGRSDEALEKATLGSDNPLSEVGLDEMERGGGEDENEEEEDPEAKTKREEEKREKQKMEEMELRQLFDTMKDGEKEGAKRGKRGEEGEEEEEEEEGSWMKEDDHPDRTLMSKLIQDAGDAAAAQSGEMTAFLDAPSHLYKRVCPSVRPSVRPSVGP